MTLLNHGLPEPSSPAIPRRVTGQYVARAHLNRKQRAWLAGELASGTAEIFPLTVKQAATLAGVPTLYVTRARHWMPRFNGKSHEETLAERIKRSSPEERLAAARIIGAAELWDTMISPIVSEDRAAK
jgi:hypothetical protein